MRVAWGHVPHGARGRTGKERMVMLQGPSLDLLPKWLCGKGGGEAVVGFQLPIRLTTSEVAAAAGRW